MLLDNTKRGCTVRTPDGLGVIVSIETDFATLDRFAVVELTEAKSQCTYFEYELRSVTEESTKKNNKPLIKDSDVIKALECCQLSNTHQVEDCNNCPFNELPQTICQNLLAYHALQIIRRTYDNN
jgi:hypothetical protein